MTVETEDKVFFNFLVATPETSWNLSNKTLNHVIIILSNSLKHESCDHTQQSLGFTKDFGIMFLRSES